MDTKRWNEIQNLIYKSPSTDNSTDNDAPNLFYIQPDWEAAREKNNHERKMEELEDMMKLREAERERKRAVVDILAIEDNGEISVETKNTWNLYSKKKVANFSHPTLKIFKNASTNERRFLISVTIGDEVKSIWVEETDCGKAKVLLEKFNASGAEFFSRKQTEKKDLIIQLWAALLRNHPEEIICRDRLGWYKDDKGKFDFNRKENATWVKIKEIK